MNTTQSKKSDLTVIVRTKEQNIFAAKRELNRQLKLIFDKNHIEVPFPQVVVHKGE